MNATEFMVYVRAPPGFDWRAIEVVAPGIRWSRATEAVVVAQDNSVARALVGAIRELGTTPDFVLRAGISDMNHAARVWQTPMASYGPGDPNRDHGPDERLSVDDFRRSIGVLENAFRRLRSAVAAL